MRLQQARGGSEEAGYIILLGDPSSDDRTTDEQASSCSEERNSIWLGGSCRPAVLVPALQICNAFVS